MIHVENRVQILTVGKIFGGLLLLGGIACRGFLLTQVFSLGRVTIRSHLGVVTAYLEAI
jgi:hypothetical protein